MIKASDLKKGDVVKMGGEPCLVETITIQTPGARGAATLYKFRFRSIPTKRKVDQMFRGDDVLEDVDLARRPVQILYGDTTSFTFMDLQDYSQYTLSKGEIEDQWPYLIEGREGIVALVCEDQILGIELPLLVPMTITETGPAAKGGSATARTKPATLDTGLVIQVPEYLTTGEVVLVDTRKGAYVSKA
jgi:elongation factor P